MNKTKKIAVGIVALMSATMMALTATAANVTNGTIYLGDASTEEQRSAIGITGELDSIVVTLEGENNTFNFLVSATDNATIEDLPVDNYKIRLAVDEPRGIYKLYEDGNGNQQGILFGRNPKNCTLNKDVIEVQSEDCEFQLAFQVGIGKTHRGYEDMVHSISTSQT